MNITLALFDLAGTVALLLWGVHMVQTGIHRALGARLRSFLAHSLGNRFSAFFAGLGITALLQSSTATGLMVSGFAAEGLIGLPQGLAVILGANVGTTLIVQLFSFDVSVIAPILVLIGYLLFRRTLAETRDFGRVFIGLGLILFALHQFLVLLDPITVYPLIRTIMTALSDHTVLVVLIGAGLAWAAHSSVAIVLLAMTLATNGVFTIPAGIALVLGANIGTALNPVFESGTSHDPATRRLPLGNLMCRISGALVALAFYPWLMQGLAGLSSSPARALADFHTGFNLVLAAIFLPLLTPWSRLLERLLPARPEAREADAPRYLQPPDADAPVSVALGGATREALRLSDVLEEMIRGLRDAFDTPTRRQIDELRALDDRLDLLNRAIHENLLAIDTSGLDEEANEKLAHILTFCINLEQAGDLIDRGLLYVVSRRLKRGVAFSKEGNAELVAQLDRLLDTLHKSTAVFLSGDLLAARDLAAEKEIFRSLEEDATTAHFERLRSGNVETIETSALHLDALRDLKRINSHLVEASAYPILKKSGGLLSTRLRVVE